jgi:iron(III) transport system ATP-binding protein
MNDMSSTLHKATTTGDAAVQLDGVSKSFGGVVAVADTSLKVRRGEFLTLLGPSGCGKTTMLRSIAGLERPDAGSIAIDGRTVASDRPPKFVPAEHRRLGMVFQSYAIWPHMTVAGNVSYALGNQRLDRAEARGRVMRALELVQLDALADRPATDLSGGQQQRVAFARAIVAQPKVLLLDEPLSNLDAKLREGMRRELRNLQRELGVTTLYVTHDQSEALALSDQIAVMLDGKILDRGSPLDIYMRPGHKFTADFVGQANFLTGRVLSAGEFVEVGTVSGKVVARKSAAPLDYPVDAEVTVFFRPESVQVVEPADPTANGRGRVRDAIFLGELVDCTIDAEGWDVPLKLRAFPTRAPKAGQEIGWKIGMSDCSVVAS